MPVHCECRTVKTASGRSEHHQSRRLSARTARLQRWSSGHCSPCPAVWRVYRAGFRPWHPFQPPLREWKTTQNTGHPAGVSPSCEACCLRTKLSENGYLNAEGGFPAPVSPPGLSADGQVSLAVVCLNFPAASGTGGFQLCSHFLKHGHKMHPCCQSKKCKYFPVHDISHFLLFTGMNSSEKDN